MRRAGVIVVLRSDEQLVVDGDDAGRGPRRMLGGRPLGEAPMPWN
jgi:hypothetical protein